MKKQIIILIFTVLAFKSLLTTKLWANNCQYTCSNGKTVTGGTPPYEDCDKIENCRIYCNKQGLHCAQEESSEDKPVKISTINFFNK